MKRTILASLACAGLLAATPVLAMGAATSTQATISHAWIRVLPGALPAGGYATVHNLGDKALRLVGADSPAYGRVMLHMSTSTGGMEHMEAVKSIPVPAHGSVSFAPGGYHLMMMQPKSTVSPGQHVQVTLHFASGASLTTPFLARPANAVDDTH